MDERNNYDIILPRFTVEIQSVVGLIDVFVSASAGSQEKANDIRVVRGESVTLNCTGNTSIISWKYTVFGTVDVKFIYTGRKLAEKVDQERVIANITGHYSSLTILNVNENDSGIYSCFDWYSSNAIRDYNLNVIGMYCKLNKCECFIMFSRM